MKKTSLNKPAKDKKKVSEKTGMLPGSLYYVGKKRDDESIVSIINYSSEEFEEKQVKKIEECLTYRFSNSISWIDVEGIHNIELIDAMGLQYGLHPLILEDIVNTEQRTKLEEYENELFLILKFLKYNRETMEVETDQISLILGKNYVISFQEGPYEAFDFIRQRLRMAKGSIRSKGADYLLYVMLDVIVDNYYSIIEDIGESIEDMEEELLLNPEGVALQSIQNNKKNLLILRKTIYPLRESLSRLYNDEHPLVNPTTSKYFRDVYDHTIQIIETIERAKD